MRVTTFCRMLFLVAWAILWSSGLTGADDAGPPAEAYRVPGNLPFLYDYDEALRQAREDGRPLFVYFAGKTFADLDRRYFMDSGVEELLGRVHRVYVPHADRLDLFLRFQVDRYNPTFLVLNDQEQNLRRMSGWAGPEYVARFLQQALDNHDRYRHGEEWVQRPEPLGDVPMTFDAPLDERVTGMTVHEGTLWCLHGQAGLIFGLDPIDGTIRHRLRSPVGVASGLAAAGDHLYILPFCWPRDPIVKLDPRTGRMVGTLGSTRKTRSCSAYAIAADAEYLYVHASRNGICKLDRSSGAVLNWVAIRSDRYRIAHGGGMEHDGGSLLISGAVQELPADGTSPRISGVLTVDPATGRLLDFDRTDGLTGGMALVGTDLLLTDWERFGHDERGHRIRLYPDRVRIHLRGP